MVRPKAYKRLSDAFSTQRQPRSTLGLAADTSAEEDPLFTLGLTWVHRASRPASGLLLYQLTTFRPATISGAAAGAHGKVPDEPREVRASASRKISATRSHGWERSWVKAHRVT